MEFIKENIIPNFIIFQTFDDILPEQIAISEAPNNALIKDLSMISNLDFNKIQPSASPDERKKHESEANIKFSEDYNQFWTQDHSNIYFWWDSTNIYFRIKEGDELYLLAIRSKGRQWHIAFYIRVTARSLEEKKNIILIDELGLFLHAKAQKDILKRLEQCAKRSQRIYTTHSPYLIPADKLNRVMLVRKYEIGGIKIRKVTAKADKETLAPILTAIGEDLSAGIRCDKKNSIVLEGYSDYVWLTAFRKVLGIKDELNLVPAVGADAEPHVGGILFGWGLDPIFVLDNDAKGKQISKKLKGKLCIDEKMIVHVPKDNEGCIENLFSDEDYDKYANLGYSKVLMALEFNHKVDKGELSVSDLSGETKRNVESVFQQLIELVK